MRLPMITLSALALAGCGSFPLGAVYAQRGQTQQERESTTLYCKDQARTLTNTDARIAASFLVGMTIVGLPVVIKSERDRTRELFAQCMGERGYRVEAP